MKISELQMTSCSVGEQGRNAAVELDGQVVGVACGMVVPHNEEFTAQYHGKSMEYSNILIPAAVTSVI